jgi:uncharacterized protein
MARLAGTAPAAAGAAFDEYISDPAKPVPFTGYITNRDDDTDYMVADQRFAARRPDVLVYETEPLEGDLRVAGPLKAKLHVSVTGTDADFVVKLIDVYPNDYPDNTPNPANIRMGGYQQLLRGEPFRGRSSGRASRSPSRSRRARWRWWSLKCLTSSTPSAGATG